MKTYSTTTTGGALLSALAAVENAGTFSNCYGMSFSHTTDANVVVRKDSASGDIIGVLRTVDEKESDHLMFPIKPVPVSDIHYDITTGGPLILFLE